MKWDVLNISGNKLKSVEIPDSIFDVPLNEHVLHSVVKAYRTNRRQGTVATKTRAFVSGGGKKPFKQKGTGEARQGTSRSPLMPGGAALHGPQMRDHKDGVNRSVRRLAFKVALSDKVRNKNFIIIDDFGISKYSTKHVCKAIESLGCEKNTVLLVDERKDNFLYKSTRNIHGASAAMTSEVNAEDVLRYNTIVLTENGLKALTQRFEER